MEKIASFTIDHNKLLPGIYVSRRDIFKDVVITTFDVRITRPNLEPVINTAELHAIEHIAATYLRNHPVWNNKTVYFGPMGCRTGVYAIFEGELTSRDVVPILKEMFNFIAKYEGEIPGASAKDCGNFYDMNLPMAKYIAQKFLSEVLNNLKEENLIYPKN
ncbi:MAG: S-ribosylhomocysteine lyase [Fusobacteria bacterium]|nr:S-ribosylhomocysteine lyase [Fusobacteriota bacterium]